MTLDVLLNSLACSTFTLASAGTGRQTVVDLVIILAAAAGMVMLLRHARIAAIPAYLITGALIGPHMLGLISAEENVADISQMATILLMFIIGLHLDPSGLGGGMVRIALLAVVATIGSILAMWPLFGLGPLGWPAGLAVAMALAMTSTAVVLRILQERRELHKLHGRIIFGSLIVQDLIALAALAALPLLAAWKGVTQDSSAQTAVLLPADWPAWGKFAFAIAGIGVLIGLCKIVLTRLLHEASKHTSQEVPLVLSAAVALGSAILAAGLGFSPELGSFLAGFVLAATPFRHQLSGQLVPLRDLFMAVFFTAVGLKLNPAVVVDGWMLILVATISLVVVKAAVMGLSAWLLGCTAGVALIYGVAMFQAGEFAIVILSVSADLKLLSQEALARLIVVVVLSLLITPSFYALALKLAPKLANFPIAGWAKSSKALRDTSTNRPAPTAEQVENSSTQQDPQETATSEPAKPPARVIIAGFGVVGRAIASRLDVAKLPYTIVDLNQATIATQTKLGKSAVFGDIANPQVLESLHVEHARAVVLTIPDEEATLRACRVIRALSPHVFIAARTTFLSKAMTASMLGADHVTVEEVATAEAMAKHVISQLQPPPAKPD
jgi:monovalent cation:H+ antiporter-2, CPA2 family